MLTDTKVSKICKSFANGSSVNINFSKTQLSKMVQLQGYIPGLAPGLFDKTIRSAMRFGLNFTVVIGSIKKVKRFQKTLVDARYWNLS